MKTCFFKLIFAFFCSTIVIIQTALAHKNGQETIVQLKDWSADLSYLNENNFDIAGYNFENLTVSVIATPAELDFLRSNGFSTKTLAFENMLDPRYQNPIKVAEKLKELETRFPGIAKRVEIGRTLLDRPIFAIKISDDVDNNDPSEPKILFNSMHHAREIMTPEIALDIAESLLVNATIDQKTSRWLSDSEIWIVPMVNPDGNHIVWNEDRMWRKNGREDFGVDNNRNYPYKWGACGGSSGSKYSQTYRGATAGSEPETQVMMNLVSELSPVTNISFHSYGELVLYSFGCSDDNTNLPLYVELAEFGNAVGRSLPRESGQGNYKTGPIHSTIYVADGGDVDWHFKEHGVLSIVIEVNREFQPNYDTTRSPTLAKMKSAWTLAIDRALSSGVRGVIKNYNQYVFNDLSAKLTNSDGVVEYRKINSDGSFQFVTANGKFTVEVESQKGATFFSKEVEVKSELKLIEI